MRTMHQVIVQLLEAKQRHTFLYIQQQINKEAADGNARFPGIAGSALTKVLIYLLIKHISISSLCIHLLKSKFACHLLG
jgi:hypothetical protein